jgi:hypothetical protein
MGTMETCKMVAASDQEKNPFLLWVKRTWPGQGHHEANHEPSPGWYNIDPRHYLSWQRLAHPEDSRDSPAEAVPYPARLLLALFVAVFLYC